MVRSGTGWDCPQCGSTIIIETPAEAAVQASAQDSGVAGADPRA